MVDSGIKCDSACTAIFSDLETRKLEYVIMVIEKVNGVDKVVVKKQMAAGDCKSKVEHDGADLKGSTAIWHCFSHDIREYKIAFGVAYANYRTKDERDASKLVFVFWCSEGAKVGDKMMYSSTKLPTSRKIKSVSCTIQCADDDDICFREIVNSASKGAAKI